MISLRAEENRYLVSGGSAREEALLRRVPGCRLVTALQALVIQRQPGSVLVLDRLFGPEGWEHAADLSQEVAEARSRQHPAAQQRAVVSLVGNELSVECAFGDKELVKLVPGYRWSAPSRRWFLPASPMALDLLSERFGALLDVADDATATIELKRKDEAAAFERAAAEPAPPTAPVAAAPIPDDAPGEPADTHRGSPAGDALLARLDRLADAVEALVATLQAGGSLRSLATVDAEESQIGDAGKAEANLHPVERLLPWQELLGEADADPAACLARVSTQLQLASEGELPGLRAIAGIAAGLSGDFSGALSYLRKAEEHSGTPLPGELQPRARAAYRDSVLGLITATCGPQRPVAAIEALEELVIEELVHNAGFEDTALAGRDCLELLSFLMDDAHLRTFEPALADYCRVLHLLAVARGGKWMAAERVVEMLRHRDLTADGFALGLLVLANTVFEQPCMDEWLMRWPPESSEIGYDDLRWIVTSGIPRLQRAMRVLAAEGALALLALISAAPADITAMDERRELVRLIAPAASTRRYAEFLAGYQLAAAGHKRVVQDFPGYLQILAQTPLRTSASHLLTVFVSDSGGAGSTTRRVAEEVFLQSIRARGVTDPAVEVIDFLDMLAESPKGDHLMNKLGADIEEDTFPGARTFTQDQRLALYERAFWLACKRGHDVDSVEAFDRLVREQLKNGRADATRALCLGIPPGFRPLQLPVAQALLTLQLEGGEAFEATAETVLKLSNPEDPRDPASHELYGLALLFPALQEFLAARNASSKGAPAPDLAGKRLVVVGGHEWLHKLALPKFDEWGVKTTWLEPDSAKNGSKALDLASGSADAIIVNTACISHAASGRVTDQAEKSGIKYAFQASRGVGALLSIARDALLDSEPPLPTRAETTKHDRRKRLVP